MVWNEFIFVMIMTHKKFTSLSNKPIADTKSGLAGLFSLSLESIEEVNVTISKGFEAGRIEQNPMLDSDFMQQRTIEDFDGHTWEIFFMDMSKFQHNKVQITWQMA